LSKNADRIKKETSLELKVNTEAGESQKNVIKVESTDQGIPFERLG
jgi:hypothetical protein